MRRALPVLLALALPLALVACGGGGALSLDPVAKAADKTAKVSGAHVTLDMGETIGGIGPIHLSMTGAVDSTTHSAKLAVDMSDFARFIGAKAGSPEAWKGDAVVDGTNGRVVEYLRLPVFRSALPAGKTWVKIDLQKLGRAQGVDFSQLVQQFGGADPTQSLELLQSVADVHQVGTEQVDGADTTRYSGTIDPSKLSAKLQGSNAAAFARLYKRMGVTSIPVDVWIDTSGYVRKLHESFTMKAAGVGSIAIDFTMGLSDFGTSVDVQPPAAGKVADISQLTKAGG